MNKLRKQSDTTYPLFFLMVDSTDHVTGKTGLSPTVTISKNGASFASPSGAVSEVGNGVYKVAGNATDSNTLGELWIHATGTAADPSDTAYTIVTYDPISGPVPSNMTQIDGLATSGNNADLKLKSLSVSNSAGNAVDFISTGSNGTGLNVAGNGSGGGIRAVGGSSGTGISGEGTTTGAGIVAYGGSTSGPGFYAAAQSGSASDGIVATALGSGNGFSAAAGGAGNAIKAVANSADAISVSVSTSNGNALSLTGRGTGAGIVSNGGATGKGIDANGSGGAADIEGNLTGNVTGSVGSVTGAVGSVTGLTASNLDATISSRMATYTQPTGFLATTFPSGTVANTTNITAGTITTVTNLTNAPTAGDLTATMKTSVTTAATAATPTAAAVTGAVGSVTGNVGGNVVGSVASVTAAVATTSNIKQNQALANFEFMMTDSTNHAPVTGKTVTCTRSIDGGAFGAGSLANVAEISNGMYRVDFAASDLNGKNIVLRATATSSDDTFERIVTQP